MALQCWAKPGVGKRGLSTFNEKIEIAKNSLKVPTRDFYFIKTEHCFVNHSTLAGLADLHFGTFYKMRLSECTIITIKLLLNLFLLLGGTLSQGLSSLATFNE